METEGGAQQFLVEQNAVWDYNLRCNSLSRGPFLPQERGPTLGLFSGTKEVPWHLRTLLIQTGVFYPSAVISL